MILQGTTPTLTISIDAAELLLEDVTEIELTFLSGTNITQKDMSNLSVDTVANRIAYTFTEAETLALSADDALMWQARFKLNNGSIVGTLKQAIKVADLISEEVMSE